MKDFKYIQNISTAGEATILLYDVIGCYVDADGCMCDGINGSAFAYEMEYLQSKATKINIRINSIGGSVLDGYSIISSILRSKIPVDTFIDGLAASIAGVIAMTGQNKLMMDYGTLMLHNPSGTNDQSVLDLVKSTLVTILTNNTKLSSEEISSIMDNETFFSASEAIDLGLVDEIITSNKKIKVDTSSLYNMAQVYNKLINPNKMQLVKNQLGLDEAVEETVIVESISALQADKEALVKELEAEKLAKEELQNKINSIEAEKIEAKNIEIENMVNSFITSGKISDDEKESMVKLASVDFDGVKNMLSKIGTKTASSIINAVNIAAPTSERSTWTIRDWEKKDSKGLATIKNETPEVYNRMFNEFYNKQK
ncbi:MAG: Clp protease ClpP [Bacteroidetes bacterium]|jgi:ATP-dependent protease ClpP protease subunit|nr:Clp protease ClpP [Bacteroidota bacterium]